MAENLTKRPKRGILKSSTSFEQRDHHVGGTAGGGGGSGCGSTERLKNPHFDESNIAATLHPPDKDYGFMKIDEPKTPYEYNKEDEDDEDIDCEAAAAGMPPQNDELNPNILAARIAMEVATGHKHQSEEDSGEIDGGGGGGASCSRGDGGGRGRRPRRLSEPSADEEDLQLLSPEERENRRKFEQKRKAHYNEFYALKMARQLIAQDEEEEEEEEAAGGGGASSSSQTATPPVTGNQSEDSSSDPMLKSDTKDCPQQSEGEDSSMDTTQT